MKTFCNGLARLQAWIGVISNRCGSGDGFDSQDLEQLGRDLKVVKDELCPPASKYDRYFENLLIRSRISPKAAAELRLKLTASAKQEIIILLRNKEDAIRAEQSKTRRVAAMAYTALRQ